MRDLKKISRKWVQVDVPDRDFKLVVRDMFKLELHTDSILNFPSNLWGEKKWVDGFVVAFEKKKKPYEYYEKFISRLFI